MQGSYEFEKIRRKSKKQFVSYSELRSKGLHPAVIAELLSKSASKHTHSSYNRAKGHIIKYDERMYDADEVAKVLRAETGKRVLSGKQVHQLRSAAINEAIALADAVLIPHVHIDERVALQTCSQYRQKHENLMIAAAVKGGNANALGNRERGCIAYIRHHVVLGYDDAITQLKRRVGTAAAYKIFKHRLNERIKQIYPEYGEL